MKKFIALLLALVMVLSLCACSVEKDDPKTTTQGTPDSTKAPEGTDGPGTPSDEKVTISLWTYPIGKWNDEATVKELVAEFNAIYPNITVNVDYLDYTNGDDKVNTAIEGNKAPDIIMEGPERLIANWGAKGLMVDLSDIVPAGTYETVVGTCTSANGELYELPVCMITHCMAINRDVFEAAGALQYLNEETHTWNSVDDFFKAVQAVYDAGYPYVGTIYCGGQGGDQGTRALAYNLYSARFANEEHTAYTMDSEAGIKGLQQLVDWVNAGLLTADPGIVAGDAIAMFCNGTAPICFCWNASAAVSNKASLADGIVPLAMAFPSDDGVPVLDGGLWGFGLFNNGNDEKVAAAKEFIKFVCDDPEQAADSVYATGFFPVRASLGDIYTGTEKAANAEFSVFMPYLGDLYTVTPGWAAQRTEWWNLLQRIFAGGDVAAEAAVYSANVNGK